MRLHTGQVAPLFEGLDLFGRYVNLEQYSGSWVLLSFYRASACPLCNLRLWHLAQRYAYYRRNGLEVIGVVESGEGLAHEYLDRLRLPFPVLLDLECKLYDRYGLESSLFGALRARLMRGDAYHEATHLRIGGHPWLNPLRMDGKWGRLPGDFVLGPDLTIRLTYYGHDAGDFLLFSELEQFVQRAMAHDTYLQYRSLRASGPYRLGYHF